MNKSNFLHTTHKLQFHPQKDIVLHIIIHHLASDSLIACSNIKRQNSNFFKIIFEISYVSPVKFPVLLC